MEIVPFEIAKKLKEKGFKEDCLCHYIDSDIVYNLESPIANNQLWFCHNKFDNIWHRDNIDAPTISQVLKWLREEKEIHIVVNIWGGTWGYDVISVPYGNSKHWNPYVENIKSYEHAALAGVNYCLDNLI